MIKNKKIISLIIIVSLIVARYIWTNNKFLGTMSDFFYLKITIRYGIPILIVVATLLLMHSPKKILNTLGLDKDLLKGLGVGFLFTLPMLIGYAIVAEVHTLTFKEIYHKIILAAFVEELLFRGFLFGVLFRYAKWGFIPAALLSAVLFASGHLYQATSFGQAFGVFGITLMGALWFAWLYIEWKKNLWVPIFLHAFMNGYWGLFSIADNAAGGLYANIFRTLTIVLSLVITIYMIKKRGWFEINKSNLLVNHDEEISKEVKV